MTAILPSPRSMTLPVVAAGAVLLGALAGVEPRLAVALAAGVAAMALAFLAPVAHLVVLLIVGVIVPYGFQNSFGLSIGSGSSGVIAFDVLLFSGLARAFLAMVRQPLERRSLLLALLTGGFLLLTAGQFLHGLWLGHDQAASGYELRNIAGLSTVMLVLPIAAHPEGRARLVRGLLVVGLALGLWGIAQWVGNFGGDEVGVSEGVAFAESGRGQILGGRYGYPVAIILAFAALASGAHRSRRTTFVLAAILLLNTIALLLTFERAFWLATVAGVLIVVARMSTRQRLRLLAWSPAALLLFVALVTTMAPGQFGAARDRLMSITQYSADTSVSYRLIESRAVIAKIRDRPLTGSGLGATVWYGRPAEGVLPSSHTYSHNAYLWLAWKLGIPLALLAVLLSGVSLSRWRKPVDPIGRAVHSGSQAAIVVVAIVGVTSPVLSVLSSTALVGVLFALAVAPPEEPATKRRPV